MSNPQANYRNVVVVFLTMPGGRGVGAQKTVFDGRRLSRGVTCCDTVCVQRCQKWSHYELRISFGRIDRMWMTIVSTTDRVVGCIR